MNPLPLLLAATPLHDAALEVYAAHIPTEQHQIRQPLDIDALRRCEVRTFEGDCSDYAKAVWALVRCQGLHPTFVRIDDHVWTCLDNWCVSSDWPHPISREEM